MKTEPDYNKVSTVIRWLMTTVISSVILYVSFAYVITVEAMAFVWKVLAWMAVWIACDIYKHRFKQNVQGHSASEL